MQATRPTYNTAHMLDLVLERNKLKNDAALARTLGVAPPVISKVRNDVLPLGPALLVKLHESTGMSTKEIKALAGID